MKALRDFPMWLFNDIPERDPRYAHRSLMVILPVATVAIAFFVWSLVALSIWIALTLGLVVIGLAFLVILVAVNRIVPKKLPADKEML
jgi:hypothetical protein